MSNGVNQQLYPMETTGSYLILLPQDDIEGGIRVLRDITGNSNIARTADSTDGAVDVSRKDEAILVLSELGVAIAELEPEQVQRVSSAVDNPNEPILLVEPEQVFYAFGKSSSQDITPQMGGTKSEISIEYLRGYRDAIGNLVDNLVFPHKDSKQPDASAVPTPYTWGLQATKVVSSRFSGRGIKVAILDTGFDFNHPDFKTRTITSKSFIKVKTSDPLLPVQDGNGHGTHCTGTACGPLNPGIAPRYGIAYEAEIYIGKVLSDQGRSLGQGSIVQGIEWAITNGCKVISMSLGGPVSPGQPFSPIYENIAKRAMNKGSLIIAAAGNSSNRASGVLNPVGSPANCPSIMAVGAIDERDQIAGFSDSGVNSSGGQVDIVGPGVDIYSSYPVPRGNPPGYDRLNGTSMATPHVAGIAALYAQANPTITADGLFSLLQRTARRLPLPSTDVGTGLVQAP
ncbi:S8 family peptidase [Synechocystis sp. PCC 7509]|uniref:S8 family peptidase n=1 Tax=Synechocystis sp. PCC 7509 TaxID=927677 RepID=UPI0002AC580E|nr:S8 family serine peptidase [Synechocystis sp. PCC 7509]